MTESTTVGEHTGPEATTISLSDLLRAPVVASAGETIGRVVDVTVRLRGPDAYPEVTGLVAAMGGRRVFVAARTVDQWRPGRVTLTGNAVDLRSFQRHDGEVLLRADVLGHRLIDVAAAELVRAYDVELEHTGRGWSPVRLDTRRRPRFFGLFGSNDVASVRDWRSFEPLIGDGRSAAARRVAGRVGALKPAQIADLLEDADRAEGFEILDRVRSNPGLEADVFSELDSDKASQLLDGMPDADVAGLLGRMRADDAADAIVDLRQSRRLRVLDLMPAPQRVKVTTLMGFNPDTAGGLMNTDVTTCAATATAGEALAVIAAATTLAPEALLKVHVLDEGAHLVGLVSVIALLQSEPATAVVALMDSDPSRVDAAVDLADVALLMADYDLYLVPVVDDEDRVLGVVTVDDVLQATIPEDWRRREPAPRAVRAARYPS
ncbi:magnesium transporter [Mycobacterium yunnanensis]|uniref:Magnesium transporter n=1 Tax=Mycobacterium yunnanensis TaxID=368477 RepID=A0A9X3C4L8_9MYCO|nr:CBS domain-containing protein [Mycobacterium yunnanensis]MCV7423712.1 magnesium transporter [Mycobacterium yunnanensis]